MNITYWTGYSKKKNSTAQPASGTDATVYLKDNCSILNPIFDCQGVPDSVNYIYVSDFGRYYFVSDVVHVTKDRIEIHCSIDVLATYKSQIGGYTADVEYAASSTNVLVTDPRNHPTFKVDEAVSNLVDLTSHGFTTGALRYIVGVVFDGGVKFLEATQSELESLCGVIYSQTFTQQIQTAFYDLKNVLVSCVGIPYEPGIRTGIPGGLTIQGITILDPAYQVSPRLLHVVQGETCAVTFPDPDGLGFYSYLDLPPYTTAALYLPYVGVVELPLDVIAETQQFILDVYLDHCTGDLIYRLSKTTGDYIATYNGNCATNIPISGSSYNAIGAVGAGITAIGGLAQIGAAAATKNPGLALSGAASLASAGVATFESLKLHTQVNGSISSAIGTKAGSVVKAMIFKRRPTEAHVNTAFKTISGLPYFKAAQISSLSGYVKCAGASVVVPGYDAEKDAVNNYLNSGFYYE